jgi:hypothetical protein
MDSGKGIRRGCLNGHARTWYSVKSCRGCPFRRKARDHRGSHDWVLLRWSRHKGSTSRRCRPAHWIGRLSSQRGKHMGNFLGTCFLSNGESVVRLAIVVGGSRGRHRLARTEVDLGWKWLSRWRCARRSVPGQVRPTAGMARG